METKRVKVQSLDNSTNVAAQISRIQMDRDKIRAKLVELSLAESTDNLDLLANQIHDIQNNGAIQAEVKEGESYSIPKGYHNGSGVVKGVAGGGNYSLQAKTVIPTKRQQNISSDEGYYGLSSVTVEPIPETYQDVTSVTATSDDVLSGKVIVTSNGSIVPGTMLNYGAANKNLDVNNTSYTIPKGYHNGNGVVTIQLEEKNVTPSKSQQVITPSADKVISSVTVDAIPDEYKNTSDATAIPSQILSGVTAYTSEGKITGTMINNQQLSLSIDGMITSQVSIPEGYTSGGQVILTSSIEDALSAI